MTLCPIRTVVSSSLLALAALGGPVALAQSHDASLDRGGKADVTQQQRYQSAIREAGGGLKVALAECKANQVALERKTCEAGAHARYKEDMAAAKAMQGDPSARPVDVKGEPIRSTETTTVIRP